MKIGLLAIAVLSSLISGCANFTSPARARALEPGQPYWLDYDATRRGAIIFPDSSKLKTCSEPSPDVALTMVAKLEASAGKESGADATAKTEFDTSVVKLAERTQMVMFLRESLYRLCEQSLNHDFTKEEVLSAYNNVIDTARAIAEADRERAKEDAAKAIKGLSEQQIKAFR